METGGAAFAGGVQTADGGAGVVVYFNAATGIVGGGDYGNLVFGDVDAQREALLVDGGEVLARFFGVFVGYVEVNILIAGGFEFVVDGPCHNVAGRQVFALVVLMHEFLSVLAPQNAAVAAHGFGNEEGGAFGGVVQRGGVKLDELHIFDLSLGAVNRSEEHT